MKYFLLLMFLGAHFFPFFQNLIFRNFITKINIEFQFSYIHKRIFKFLKLFNEGEFLL